MKLLPASTQASVRGHTSFSPAREKKHQETGGTLQEAWNIPRAGTGAEDVDLKNIRIKMAI